MWNEFKKWYYYNTTLFWGIFIGTLVVLSLVWFFIFVFEFPPKDGRVVKKYHKAESLYYDIESDDVYRTVTETRIVDGKSQSYTRSVYDYTRYRVRENFDGEDYCIVIEAPSKKHEGKMLNNTIFVTKYVWDRIDDGSMFFFSEENGDSVFDRNNYRKGVSPWFRYRPDLTEWKSKEY
jgi:hypothetical protein